MTQAYLGLGSNIGDRQAYLAAAIKAIAHLPKTSLLKQASYYETKAWGLEDQADFLNSVCLIETTLTAVELLRACLAIEQELGRERLVHWGPRVIDIDVLLYGDEMISTKELTLPHPYIEERAFVLVPLLELTPDLISPKSKQSYQKALDQLDTQTVHLI